MAMPNKLKLNDSAFAMWRGIVALGYIDHKLTHDEVGFFKKQLERIELTETQKQTLDNDLANGLKLEDVYNDITEPSHRTNLLNMGYVIFHRDGDFCHVEKAFYDELYNKHIQGICPDKLGEETKKSAQEDLESWAKQRDYKEDLPGLSDDVQEFFSWLF